MLTGGAEELRPYEAAVLILYLPIGIKRNHI